MYLFFIPFTILCKDFKNQFSCLILCILGFCRNGFAWNHVEIAPCCCFKCVDLAWITELITVQTRTLLSLLYFTKLSCTAVHFTELNSNLIKAEPHFSHFSKLTPQIPAPPLPVITPLCGRQHLDPNAGLRNRMWTINSNNNKLKTNNTPDWNNTTWGRMQQKSKGNWDTKFQDNERMENRWAHGRK